MAVLGEADLVAARELAHRRTLAPHQIDLGLALGRQLMVMHREGQCDADAAPGRAVATLDQRLAGFELPVIRDQLLAPLAAVERCKHLREGRPAGADGDDGADADLGDTVAVMLPSLRVVDPHDVVAPAEIGDAGGRPGLQPLQRRELRLGVPEIRRRSDRVDPPDGLVPDIAVAATQRLDQAMAGMGMAVDQPRQDRLAMRVDDPRRRVLRLDLRARPDRDDAIACDGDGAVLDHAARRIHRDDDAAGDQDVGHPPYSATPQYAAAAAR